MNIIPFNSIQKAELLSLLDIRRDTVADDPTSADALEKLPGALDMLEAKINEGAAFYSDLEREWLTAELLTRVEVLMEQVKNAAPKDSRGIHAVVKSLVAALATVDPDGVLKQKLEADLKKDIEQNS